MVLAAFSGLAGAGQLARALILTRLWGEYSVSAPDRRSLAAVQPGAVLAPAGSASRRVTLRARP